MEAKDLTLEINQKYFDGEENNFKLGNVNFMVTPPLDEEYWQFRVKVHDDQAIVGFPKFSQIGIGFAKEDDWNTNLPSSCKTKKIFNHIKHNKRYASIPDELCIKAIDMIKRAVKKMEKAEREAKNALITDVVPELFDENGKEISNKAFKEQVWYAGSKRRTSSHLMLFGQGESGYKYKAHIVGGTKVNALKRFKEMIRDHALGMEKPNIPWRGESFDYKAEGAKIGFDGSFT